MGIKEDIQKATEKFERNKAITKRFTDMPRPHYSAKSKAVENRKGSSVYKNHSKRSSFKLPAERGENRILKERHKHTSADYY